MRIAVPSVAPGGMEASTSAHFGHCDVFTLVDVEDGEVKQVTGLQNLPHAHGGCMAPVQALKQAGADALVAGGMGMRPLQGFQQVGISVFFNEGAQTVEEAIGKILAGQAREFGPAQTCSGGGGGSAGGCGGHHH